MEQLTRATAPGAISLATGHPAPETFPLHDFGRAFHRTLLDDPPELMQYRSSTGDPDLCETLAAHLRRRGCSADASDVIVCSGAQQAADIVATVLLDERSVVASESPTYSGTLGVFDARGVTYVEVRGDDDGVRIDDVERVFSEYRPRLFYINPIAQNPDRRGFAGAAREANRRARAALRRGRARGSNRLGAHLRCRRAAAAGLARHRRPRDLDGKSFEIDLSGAAHRVSVREGRPSGSARGREGARRRVHLDADAARAVAVYERSGPRAPLAHRRARSIANGATRSSTRSRKRCPGRTCVRRPPASTCGFRCRRESRRKPRSTRARAKACWSCRASRAIPRAPVRPRCASRSVISRSKKRARASNA